MNSLKQIWPKFGDNESAIRFALKNGLLKSINRCKEGRCRSRMKIELDASSTDGKIWRCSNSRCRSKRSIREASFFANARLDMSTMLMFMYLWSKDYTSKFIREELELARSTAVDWSRFCRGIAVYHYENEELSNEKIGGIGVVVEIDESVFSKRKYHRGGRVKETWVFGGVNRENSNELFVEIIPDRTQETLLEVYPTLTLKP